MWWNLLRKWMRQSSKWQKQWPKKAHCWCVTNHHQSMYTRCSTHSKLAIYAGASIEWKWNDTSVMKTLGGKSLRAGWLLNIVDLWKCAPSPHEHHQRSHFLMFVKAPYNKSTLNTVKCNCYSTEATPVIRHTIFIINFGSRTAAPPNHVARVRFSLFGMCTSVCVCACACVHWQLAEHHSGGLATNGSAEWIWQIHLRKIYFQFGNIPFWWKELAGGERIWRPAAHPLRARTHIGSIISCSEWLSAYCAYESVAVETISLSSFDISVSFY